MAFFTGEAAGLHIKDGPGARLVYLQQVAQARHGRGARIDFSIAAKTSSRRSMA
ncbi:hypothetical protein [Arthrobacter sp. MYb229]|uniref:hypothetical protein n=1 Tax=Arthrobacter sp. MYb229 TaxID=1848602 RepID=UPI0015E46B5F|nr:hypothetical protein [Arthrobacter sp. MYb229]